MNLKLMLEETVRRYRDKTALVMEERRQTYGQLDEEANRVASALTDMGVVKGDRVAMLMANSLEFVAIYFGIVKIGAIAVPLDPKYKPTELTALFNDCQPKILMADASLLEPLLPAVSGWEMIERVIEVGADGTGRFLSYQQLIASALSSPPDVEIMPEDVTHIAYTSGPSLQPRGVMLTHGNIVAEVKISADGFQQTDKDIVVLFALPMHHAFGLVVLVLTSIYTGSTLVMLPGVSVSSLMELIERERVTIFMAVPFIHTMVVNQAEEEGIKCDLSSLRLCASAGAALPEDIADRFQKYYGFEIVDFWGMTESTGHVTCQSLDSAAKRGSVGKPLPGWELKVVDENGRELPPNQPGEIVVRGPVMAGYYRHHQDATKAMRDGWLYTGDLGRVDEEGEVFLVGMKKDMILAKGQNIYPSDIEEVIRRHPQVAEVVVVGVPDKARGEIIKAVISLKSGGTATEQEIKRLCLEHLANYKVPKQVVFVDSLPRTSSGEIFKDALR